MNHFKLENSVIYILINIYEFDFDQFKNAVYVTTNFRIFHKPYLN